MTCSPGPTCHTPHTHTTEKTWKKGKWALWGSNPPPHPQTHHTVQLGYRMLSALIGEAQQPIWLCLLTRGEKNLACDIFRVELFLIFMHELTGLLELVSGPSSVAMEVTERLDALYGERIR